MKYITFAVPSYNSQDYLRRCIDSLLPGGDDVEIIIVNDGSSDNTAQIADGYAVAYPNIVRVIHKENGGHGSGVNAGIREATGVYYKVVDSDDWVDKTAYLKLLDRIKKAVNNNEEIDLFLTNYVYNRLNEGLKNVINYTNVIDSDIATNWESLRNFKVSQYFMMHSLTYKLSVLKEAKLVLPEHTFYVDNIYSIQPLPYVKKMMYLNLDFYQYYIGREDQSVNEKSMVKRIDQQFLVTRLTINCHDMEKIRKEQPRLAKYMTRYMSILVCITSILCDLSNKPEHRLERKKLWKEVNSKDKAFRTQVKYFSLNFARVLPDPVSRPLYIFCYRYAKKKYMFA